MNLWLISQKKHCINCGSNKVIRWGRQNNKQRYFCKEWGKLFIWKNIGAGKNQKLKLFRKWIIGKLILKELSIKRGKLVDTLIITFKGFLENPPTPKPRLNNNCHLTIDGTHFKNNFCVLAYYDSGFKKQQSFRVVDRECRYNHMTDCPWWDT